jgi:trimethylamine---corrinoid protein Co-methyltransferase
VYGGTSTITDMRTGLPSVGAPEQMILQNAQVQIAKNHNLPCRGSGGISDGFIPDGQAAMESAMALVTTLRSGSNFIIQSAGSLGAYLMMSYEKFIMDEEILARILRMFKPLDFSDDQINLDTIQSVGIGNEYLTHPTTLKHFKKEYYVSNLTRRQSYDAWVKSGKKTIHEVATQKVAERIDAFERPDIPPDIEADLNKYVGLNN